MLTPLLLVEPHSTFIVCITVLSVSLLVTSDDGLVTSQHEPVVRRKKSVKMVPVPIPKSKKYTWHAQLLNKSWRFTYELSDPQIFHQRSQEPHTTTPKCSNNSYSRNYLSVWILRNCCCCEYCAIDVDLTRSSELVLTMDFGCWCLCFADCCWNCKVSFVVVLFRVVGLVVHWAEVEVKSSLERENNHHHQPL